MTVQSTKLIRELQYKEAIKQYQSGIPMAKVGLNFGKSHGWVYYILKTHGNRLGYAPVETHQTQNSAI